MGDMDTDRTTARACLLVMAWVCLGWIPVDRWLKRNGHPYLTTQFRLWLRSPRFGWAIWGGLAALPVMFVAHLLIKETSE